MPQSERHRKEVGVELEEYQLPTVGGKYGGQQNRKKKERRNTAASESERDGVSGEEV